MEDVHNKEYVNVSQVKLIMIVLLTLNNWYLTKNGQVIIFHIIHICMHIIKWINPKILIKKYK